MSASEREFGPWNEALAEWGEGPRTMKATADWANRWIHRLRTEDERKCIALATARAEARREAFEEAAKFCDAEQAEVVTAILKAKEGSHAYKLLGEDAKVLMFVASSLRAKAGEA